MYIVKSDGCNPFVHDSTLVLDLAILINYVSFFFYFVLVTGSKLVISQHQKKKLICYFQSFKIV